MQPEFEELIRDSVPVSRGTLRILDVGCGPLSVLGKKVDGLELDLIGVDPLASEYSQILKTHGIAAPHKTLASTAESLLDLFEPNSFEFVHSRNALDHCEDPIRVIANMLTLVKEHCYIFINICQNEAENAGYTGFHRWNFDIIADQVVIWNPSRIELLDNVISGFPYNYHVGHHQGGKKFPDQIDIVIRKTAPLENLPNIPFPLSASFSQRNGWLTITAPNGCDEDLPFFVHGLSREGTVLNRSFRWYNNRIMRTIRLPRGKFATLRIGQFFQDFNQETRPFVNAWHALLQSTD
jgi:SAM-dependent methyltransferase